MVSLGCAKNLVDSEIMLGTLLRDGVEIVSETASADAVIVNTCSFIDKAQEESVDAILELAADRDRENPCQAILVAGCLTQRFRQKLPRLLPEVDGFMGIDQVGRVTEIIREAREHRATMVRGGEGGAAAAKVTARPVYIPDYATPRFRLTPGHMAYVKIAEGCNHPCSFCTIPRMRGGHRSRPQADIVEEARRMLAEGVRELNLISQDTTFYGRDWRRGDDKRSVVRGVAREDLCTLLKELDSLEGDFWIRLLYTHPAHWTDEMIGVMAECAHVARYVDMPLQHIHPEMLDRMRRETSRAHIEELIGRLRDGIPDLALRSTFIVGFPGETEAHFQSLLEFIESTRFERLGIFTYSRESGTPAARMNPQVHPKTREKRRRLAMQQQHRIAKEISAEQLGKTMRVLVERPAEREDFPAAEVRSWEHGLVRDAAPAPTPHGGSTWIARSEFDAPDIDGRVFVQGPAAPGQFLDVCIVGHADYDLLAEPVAVPAASR